VDLGRFGPHPDVVPVERDVERADEKLHALDALDLAGEPPREVVAPGRDPDQHDALGTVVALEDLVRDARDRPPDLALVQQLGGAHQNETPRRLRGRAPMSNCMFPRLPSRPRRTGLKGEVVAP